MRVLRAAASIHAIVANVALTRPLARILEHRLAGRVTEHTAAILDAILCRGEGATGSRLTQALDSHLLVGSGLLGVLEGQNTGPIDALGLVLGEANFVEVDDGGVVPHLVANLVEDLATAALLVVARNARHLAASGGVQRVVLHELGPRLAR